MVGPLVRRVNGDPGSIAVDRFSMGFRGKHSAFLFLMILGFLVGRGMDARGSLKELTR